MRAFGEGSLNQKLGGRRKKALRKHSTIADQLDRQMTARTSKNRASNPLRHIYAMKKPKIDPKDSSTLDKHIGGRIRNARQALSTSQASLGEAVGVTFQQMQKYESGRNRISAARLFLVCQSLQVPITFMFEGFDSNRSSQN
jgi:DNA-binding XRE family transcriptional regulator